MTCKIWADNNRKAYGCPQEIVADSEEDDEDEYGLGGRCSPFGLLCSVTSLYPRIVKQPPGKTTSHFLRFRDILGGIGRCLEVFLDDIWG